MAAASRDASSAAYWALKFDALGSVNAWTWNCETCPALGIELTEADTVSSMNAHVAEAHPDTSYNPTPVPEQ